VLTRSRIGRLGGKGIAEASWQPNYANFSAPIQMPAVTATTSHMFFDCPNAEKCCPKID
jgi:hypothetical protein